MKKKVADKSLEDTGERMIPAYSRGFIVYGEHMTRYKAILPLLVGKRVLDIASGSGYGSALIGEVAKETVGVDISQDAIDYSKKNYSSRKIKFILGHGTKIPLSNASMDVVVSFETIEHIEDYTKFLDEIKRVLKPDGLLVLSTPNDQEYSADNHFHIHEFTEQELRSLVGRYFKNQDTYYQGDWIYSAILRKQQLKQEWTENIMTYQTATIDTEKAIYFLMVASDRLIKEKIESLAFISEHWSARQQKVKEIAFKKHMDEQAAIIKHFQNELNHEKEVISELSHQNQELIKDIDNIKQSIYWRTRRRVSGIKSKLTKNR